MKHHKISPSITNRDIPSLNKYLQEIGKIDLISSEREVELVNKIRQGDEEALQELVRTNLRFVVSIAKQYQNLGINLGDLINEGNIGLIKAAKKFDSTQGFKFISYAVWWIRQSILRAVAEHSRVVHLPFNQVDTLSKVKRVYIKLEQQYEREPSISEIAEYLGITVEKISDLLSNTANHVSIHTAVLQDEEHTLLDVLPNNNSPETDSNLIKESLSCEIKRHMAALPERESQIIDMFFGLDNQYPLTLEEISEKISLTRERVRQLKEKALEKLHLNSRSILQSYV